MNMIVLNYCVKFSKVLKQGILSFKVFSKFIRIIYLHVFVVDNLLYSSIQINLKTLPCCVATLNGNTYVLSR